LPRALTMLCHRLALELVCKRSRRLAKAYSHILHREVLLTEALNPAGLGWLRAHAKDVVTLRVEASDLNEGMDTVAAAVRCLLCRSAQLQDGRHWQPATEPAVSDRQTEPAVSDRRVACIPERDRRKVQVATRTSINTPPPD